jgi:hypothetical protein
VFTGYHEESGLQGGLEHTRGAFLTHHKPIIYFITLNLFPYIKVLGLILPIDLAQICGRDLPTSFPQKGFRVLWGVGGGFRGMIVPT